MPPRFTRGRTSSRRSRAAAVSSRTMSTIATPIVRSALHRVGEVGVVARAHAVAGAPFAAAAGRARRAASELMVRLTCGASPVNRLPRLAPSPASSPRPSECRRSISAASSGCETRTIRSRSFSYQRNPRMSWLVPCRMPLTLGAGLRAPVGVPGGQRVAARPQPGGQRRHRPVADGAAGGVVGQRVDLQEQHAGRPVRPAVGAARPAAGAAEEQLVLVDGEQAADQARDRRDDDGDEHRDAEVGDVRPRGSRTRSPAPRRPAAGSCPARR